MRAILVTIGVWFLCVPSIASGPDTIKGSGTSKTESRETGEFKVIEISGSGTAELTVGAKAAIEVTADDNIVPLIETRIESGKLIIDTAKGRYESKMGVVIRVTSPTIEAVGATGAAKIGLSGVENESLTLISNGAGSIRVSGKTDSLTAKLNGAAKLDTAELMSRSVQLELRGSGRAVVHATETLGVLIEGAGAVQYLGDPKVEQTIRGAGSVTRKKEKE